VSSNDSDGNTNVLHVQPWVGWLAVALLAALPVYSILPHGKAPNGPPGAVGGSISKTCDGLKCTSPDAARALETSDVWCAWSGSTVTVHSTLKNTMAASVQLWITPKYTIKNGGQHGTSINSAIKVELPAGAALDWTGNAGSPEGVAAGTPIDECKPHLHDIDIANIAP
jgi:hypothetical protein